MINFFNDKKIVAIYLGKVGVNSTGNTVTYNIDENSSNQLDVVGGINVVTLMNPTKSGYTFVGWREDKTASADVLTSKTMGSEPITLYAVFKKNYTLNAVSYNSTQKVTGVAYYNNGNVATPTVTVPNGASYSGWTWRGWAAIGATAGNADVAVANGGSINVPSDDATIYGLYQKTITVTYYDNATTAKTTTGTRYYSSSGNIVNPSFTLAQASKSGWTARGWSTSNTGNGTVTYKNNTAFTRDSNVTLYGMYQQTVTVTYYNNSTTASTKDGTRYWAPAGYVNPSFNLSQASVSGWTARGWSTGTAGNSSVTYKNATAFTRDSNVTIYGTYQKTVTLSYNGNGATSGSVSSHSSTAYRNYAGTVVGASFTLKSNGFTKNGYNFNKWDLGAVGATITLSDNKTAYAQWTQVWSSTLNVFTAESSNYWFKYGGTLTNSEYATYSFSSNPLSCGADLNDEYGDEPEEQKSGTITINYNGFYTRAVIELYDSSQNEYNSDREAWYRYWISGQTAPGWQTHTSTTHTVTMYASSGQTVLNLAVRAVINGDNSGLYTWVDSALAIKSITLYKD